MVAPPNAPGRTYAAAHFGLQLDGFDNVGLFRSIEGGGVKTDVMTYQLGGTYERWRQLGKPKFDDLKLQVGMAMSAPFYKWIQNFFLGIPDRKNGSILAADFYYNERARRKFTNGMIKELTFPKLDATDKGAAFMSIGVSVDGVEFIKGDGKKIITATGFNQQKLWTACNFNLSFDNLPSVTTRRISKIDSFTVKQTCIEYHSGGYRAPQKVPSAIDFPPISFYVPEADAAPYQKHFHDRGIKGQVPGRLSGQIQTYDNEMSPLFTLAFKGADFSAITPDKADASTEEIKQIKVDMYTESMEFTYTALDVY